MGDQDNGQDDILPSLSLDTDLFPPGEGYETTRRIQTHFEIRQVTEGEFRAKASAWRLGHLIVTSSTQSPLLFERTEKLTYDGADHYLVVVMLDAEWQITIAGEWRTIAAGEICLIDMTQPYITVSREVATTIILQFPRPMLESLSSQNSLHGLVLSAPAGRLFSQFIVSLVQHLPIMGVSEASAVADGVRDLLLATLRSLHNGNAASPSGGALLPRARAYIARNLSGDLSPSALCKALNTSRSSLNRSFAPLGGVAAFVLRQRLGKAMTLLLRPQGQELPVSTIAFSVGFQSAAHFSRKFREVYGFTPREASGAPSQSSLPDNTASDVADEFLRIKRTLWN